jgi:hypothetical protein
MVGIVEVLEERASTPVDWLRGAGGSACRGEGHVCEAASIGGSRPRSAPHARGHPPGMDGAAACPGLAPSTCPQLIRKTLSPRQPGAERVSPDEPRFFHPSRNDQRQPPPGA